MPKPGARLHSQRQADLYRLALDHLPEAVLLTDLETNFLFVSAQAAQVFGLPLAELEARGSLDRLFGKTPFNLAVLGARGELRDQELILEGEDGAQCPLSVDIRLLSPEGDRPAVLLFAFRKAVRLDGETRRLVLNQAHLETQNALAELQVAEEELREQNEALFSAQQELERERLRYQELFEQAPDGYLVTDERGTIQEANRAAGALLNVQPQHLKHLKGKPLSLYIAPQSLKVFRKRLKEFEGSTSIQDWEVLLQPRQGDPYPVSLSVSAVPGPWLEPGLKKPAPGLTLRWLLRDIRERKAAQEALQQANETLEAQVAARTAELASSRRQVTEILESIADGFFVLDQEWRFTYLNRRAAGNGGLEPGDLLGVNLWAAYPQLLGTLLETNYRQVMEDRKPVRFEHRSLFADRWYQINVYPTAEGISVYSQDITRRKRAEAEAEAHQAALQALSVQHAEARLRAEQMAGLAHLRLIENEAVFDAIADAVVVYAATGLPVRANPAAIHLFGFDPVALNRVEVSERLNLKYPDGSAVPLEKLPRARAQQGQWVVGERYIFSRSDNDELSILASASPLRGLDGQVDGAVTVWHDVTDLDRAVALQSHLMEENRRQRELLEHLVEEAPVGIVLLDGPEHRLTLANPAFIALVGEERARIAHRVAETWPDVGEDVLQMLDEVYRTGQPFFGEDLPFTIERPAGPEDIYFTAKFTPMRDPGGVVAGILAIIEDTTSRVQARQQAESAYQQAEGDRRLLQTIIENAPEGITVADSQGQVILSNPAAEQIYARPVPYGLPIETHSALQICSLEGDPIPPRELPLSRSALDGEVIRDQELAILWPDGQRRSLLVNSAPIRDMAGSLSGAVAVFQDITERKRLEERLRWSQASEEARAAEVEALMDAVPAMVLVAHDPECRLVTGNRTAYRLLGLPVGMNLSSTPGEAEGRVPFDVYPAEQPEEWGNLPLQVAASQGLALQDVREQVVFPNGRTLHLYGNIIPLFAEGGGPRGALAAFTDISRLVETERALEEYTAQLEASHRELKDFAFIASHDLQEPLRKVQAFSDRLVKEYGTQLGAPALEYLQRMENATQRMQQMIRDLLEYSRVSTHAQPFQLVDLHQVVAKVLADLDLRLEKSGGRVEVGELPAVEADPLQMHQLFENLLVNGLKFHREGVPPVVKVYARETADEGRTTKDEGSPSSPVNRTALPVEIVIEDNGIGFDDQHIGRLFQPFQRLVGRSEYEGSGMGLAICRKIVERHGGQIGAHGIPGQGAIFVLRLPARQQFML